MANEKDDPAFLASVLHAARFGRRRHAAKMLHAAGLPSGGEDVEEFLRTIKEHALYRSIARASDKIEADARAKLAAEDRGKALNVPPWLVCESTDAAREFIFHARFPRFMAEVITLREDDERGDPIAAYRDELSGQEMLHPIWIDEPKGLSPDQITGLYIAAMRELELYGQASEAALERAQEEEDAEGF